MREVSLATHRDFLKNDLIAALQKEIMAGVPEAFGPQGDTVCLAI